MPLTEAQLAKVVAEIDALTKKADGLEDKARTQDDYFLSAARTYGSELAGSSGTDYLYGWAKQLRQRVEFLEKIKSEAIPIDSRQSLKNRLRVVTDRIEFYTAEKQTLELILREFELLHKLLSL